MKKKKELELAESAPLSEAFFNHKVDEQAGIIRDVVLMTANKVSKNKTKYLPSALQEAVSRYDGATMYLDHPRKDELENRRGARSVRDAAGTYHNLRVQESKLMADVHLLEHNKNVVISLAKAPPKGAGLSLRDNGRTYAEGGVTLVEGFVGENFSIDLVSNNSLNQGLFESARGGEEQMKNWNEITIEDLQANCPNLVESIGNTAKAALSKELEESGVKSLEAQKLVALAEANMPAEFKNAIRTAVLKKEVTLEEAKQVIATQMKLSEGFVVKPPKKEPDPAVKGLKPGAKGLEEGAPEGLPTDEQIVAAFK